MLGGVWNQVLLGREGNYHSLSVCMGHALLAVFFFFARDEPNSELMLCAGLCTLDNPGIHRWLAKESELFCFFNAGGGTQHARQVPYHCAIPLAQGI